MAKSTIQFQKGLSLSALLSQFGTEDQAGMPCSGCDGPRAFGAHDAVTAHAARSGAERFTSAMAAAFRPR